METGTEGSQRRLRGHTTDEYWRCTSRGHEEDRRKCSRADISEDKIVRVERSEDNVTTVVIWRNLLDSSHLSNGEIPEVLYQLEYTEETPIIIPIA